MIIRKICCRSTEGELIPKPRQFAASVGRSRIYCTAHKDGHLELLQMYPWDTAADKELVDYFKRQRINNLSCQCEEITVSAMEDALQQVEDEDVSIPSVMAPAGLMPFIAMPFSMAIDEAMCEGHMEPERAVEESKEIHSASLTAELERNSAGKGQAFRGHPFVYVCRAANMKKANRFSDLLIGALRGAHRLPSGRICRVNLTQGEFPEQVVEDIYRGQSGASVSLELDQWPEDGREVKTMKANLQQFLAAAQRHRGSVLTVIHVGQEERFLPLLQEGEVRLLTLIEDALDRSEGRRLLDKMARECGFRKAPASLLRCLPTGHETFTDEQTQEIFSGWYDNYLLKKAYPQYKTLAVPEGSKSVEVHTPQSL